MPGKTRAILAGLLILSILGLALYSNSSLLYSLRGQWLHVVTGQDGPSQWESRMGNLKPYLPSGGVIGYLSERDMPGLSFSPIDQDEEMVMTQFFLAPRIIEEGANRPLIVGNFGSPETDLAAIEQHFGIRLVKNVGMGIYLFEK